MATDKLKPMLNDLLPKHIKKGHKLVFSRQDLSSREADLFALMIANMTPTDWVDQSPVYQFASHNLSKWLDLDSKHIGTILRPAAKRLNSREVGVESKSANGDIEFQYEGLFKHISYKKGVLTMIPNDMLRSEYIEYNQGFALINTKNFLELKREYSKRLYELLSRFKDSGTHIGTRSIEELQGLFGLLTESGKLKSDKTSFRNNGVFLQRCIRDSIQELMEHPQTSKELVFFEGSSGAIGYEPVKNGRTIVALEFKVRWISKKNPIVELNTQDAMQVVRELENQRITKNKELTIEELTQLKFAYEQLGTLEKVALIEASIEKRKNKNVVIEQVNQEVEDFLASIEKLESHFPDVPDY
ncbi:RepB family plasmid replication initiator protein [Vibrio sp. 10N.286.49.B3]|uniref:replication initiation protein n=1 Tax=Vibrio sp. 10N.286.49.B3 TaxID=1880855 RepID=UPI000C857924|nr:replication initiation protein [Vibrio sp. 10N.286.49.B3]PMH44885.1 RepB family plasmid replication initiator protein [Vibrio sp. 10N.286.49.B3]